MNPTAVNPAVPEPLPRPSRSAGRNVALLLIGLLIVVDFTLIVLIVLSFWSATGVAAALPWLSKLEQLQV